LIYLSNTHPNLTKRNSLLRPSMACLRHKKVTWYTGKCGFYCA